MKYGPTVSRKVYTTSIGVCPYYQVKEWVQDVAADAMVIARNVEKSEMMEIIKCASNQRKVQKLFEDGSIQMEFNLVLNPDIPKTAPIEEREGKMQGNLYIYYKNGKIAKEEKYENGVPVGEAIFYD
mmetsp:Transcript_40947/g.39500  ORF Transcript_40947/g.39500 Transcript_40947/m.39500 type:complete len:127 (+) Transcript_40947:124-504(+)